MTPRVSTGSERLDAMLGGGLLPGTLTVVYGATGIGKPHLGLAFCHHGRHADRRPGLVFDMNARGDSQQHHAYAARLYGWDLRRWSHTVTPMAQPFPSPEQMEALYCDALYTVRPFVYFHLGAGSRRIMVDGIEPMDTPGEYIQPYIFDELYRKVIHRDSETLGMEICLPVWQHREFIESHRYDHSTVTTLLLVTTEETQIEHLIARKVASGDIGAVANTILAMGSERVGNRLGRFLCVVKHRGSAMSDEIAEFRVGERGIELA